MRFKNYKISSSDGEGTRLSKSFGMYDISTAVTIHGDCDGGDAEVKKPKVFCASRDKWLSIAAGCDLSVFDLAVGVEHKWSTSFKETDQIIAATFLPDDDLLLIVLASGVVAVCVPNVMKNNAPLMKQELLLPSMVACSVAIVNEPDRYAICVLELRGIAHFLDMDKFNMAIKRELDTINPVRLVFSSERAVGNASFVVWALNCFAFFPQRRSEYVRKSSVHPRSSAAFSDWSRLAEDVRAVKNVGQFVVALTANNRLVFYNLQLTRLYTLDLVFSGAARSGNNDAQAVDFEFLDVDAFCDFTPDVRILFTIKTHRGNEFVLKSLADPTALFNTCCSDDVILVPHATPGDDSNIIFLEAFTETEPNDLVVRFVSEAQPSLRLKRLLDNGRYTEALEFAKTHDLSLDIVYVALIRKCQDNILSESGYEETIFDDMMKYLALLSDHDEASDYCVAALRGVHKYEHIVKLLEFTQREKIKDLDTINAITEFRYELGSYRLLFGATKVAYDWESEWSAFLSIDNHMGMFDAFCRTGKITEARVIFDRYPSEISSHFAGPGATARLLDYFSMSITENPATSVAIAEFLESSLLKFFLLGMDIEHSVANSNSLFQFLIDTARNLECIQSKGFPENSLFFALSFSRGLSALKQKCLTGDQQLEPILVLDHLNVDTYDESFNSGKLNVLVRNLKNLLRIHRVYQCPMSYSEYLNCNVYSICSSILDRVRTAQSVRDHIESFVFPYMIEHNLDKNDMLYRYIKNLASMLYRGSSQYSNSWDQLCLQIAESIVDADLRCKAVIEIAAGSIPPWSEQLMTVVKNTLTTNVDGIDPSLIQQLRVECRRAELGQIFVAYHIPLNFRNSQMDAISLGGLLQFIFRNSDKDPSIRLNDAFKILSIYECLAGHVLLTRTECYCLYAISIVSQLQDEYDLSKLIDFFNLIKSSEKRAEVAWKLVYYLKSLIMESSIKKIHGLRLIWLSSLLCVLERFVAKDRAGVEEIVRQAHNIRVLQLNHNLVIGFATLENHKRCIDHFTNFIINYSTVKSLFEVVAFGELLSLPIRRIFETIVNLQIEQGLVEASLTTLEFYIERQLKPELIDLDACLHVCTTAMWKITQAAIESGTEYEPLVRIVKVFKSTLPTLIDWSTLLLSVSHVESFCKINMYVTLLTHILDLCAVDKNETLESEEMKTPDEYEYLEKTEKMYTNRRRVAAFLPQNESSFFDHNTVIRNTAIVASSVVKPPMNSENFDNEMVEYWHRLFDALSSHKLLEVLARQFAQTLPCFVSIRHVNGPTMGMRQCVSELCQKILNVATADLPLAAHLLLCLSMQDMKTVLHDLRRWVANNRKNVRISLNVIRLSLFVLIESRDFSLQQQLATLFEATLWQKRFTKLGAIVNSPNSLRKEVVHELVGEFVRILIAPSILKRFCQEMKVSKQIMLNYAIELCKISSSFVKDRERFAQTISTAKTALREVEVDEEVIQEVMTVINQLCPYNYEVLELLLKQMEEWTSGRRSDYETWTKDRLLLLSFLMMVKREKGYCKDEVQWYRSRSNAARSGVNNSTLCSLHSEDTSLLDEDTQSAVPNSVSALLGGLYRKQDVFDTNFPPHSIERLPFHLFLSPENKDRLSQAVIHHELSIYNVLKWISIIEETSEILQHSRTSLIVIAITNDVSNAIKYKRELTTYDLDQIRMLSVRDPDRRLIIVKSSCQRFRKLPLCDIKISVFKICCEIADDSIAELSKQSDDAACDDKAAFIDFRNALKQTLAQSTTDLLLSKNNLLDSNTSALSNKAIALISYICSNCIDWNDNVNIETHFRVVEEIAKVNEVNLSEVYDELILNWLPGSEGVEVGNTHADPDATIDFLGADGGGAVSLMPTSIDDEVPLPVLYDDPSISKIVFLLNRCDPEQKARTIFTKFQQESCQTPASYTTKMRTACCLLRYLSNEQMQQILGTDKNKFCIDLVGIITGRLLNICRVGISSRDYFNADKVEFVRSLLSPQSFRQTSEIAHLITCMIVDNGITDIALIDKAAYRLMQLRMVRPLTVLLEYTRRFPEAKHINNIATYYARVFESNYDKIIDYDDDDKEASENMRKKLALVHHLLGCPVEGGTNFSRARTLLSSIPCAASLVAIASSSTEKIGEVPVPKTGDILLNRAFI